MNILSNDLLSVVDRLSGRLGPVSTLIDAIVNRVAPKATAQASCPPPNTYVCGYQCGACCRNCSGDYSSWIYVVYSGNVYCDPPYYQCLYTCDYC